MHGGAVSQVGAALERMTAGASTWLLAVVAALGEVDAARAAAEAG